MVGQRVEGVVITVHVCGFNPGPSLVLSFWKAHTREGSIWFAFGFAMDDDITFVLVDLVFYIYFHGGLGTYRPLR